MRQFRRSADVIQHFEQQAELRTMPEPPPDLWEQVDTECRKGKQPRKPHPLIQPNVPALPCVEIKPSQKTHPVSLMERFDPVPNVPPPMRRTYVLKPVP